MFRGREGRRSRKSCESLRQVIPIQVDAGINFPWAMLSHPLDTGVKARRLYTPHRRCRPVPAQWALPLDPQQCAAAPAPRHRGLAASAPPAPAKLASAAEAVAASLTPAPTSTHLRLSAGSGYGNTPAGIAGQNIRCSPGIFTVISPISGYFLPPLPPESHAPLRRHWRRLFRFLTVRRDEPDRQPALVQYIGHAALRRTALQPAQQRGTSG